MSTEQAAPSVLTWLKAGISLEAASSLSGLSVSEIVALANGAIAEVAPPAPAMPRVHKQITEDRNLEIVRRYESGERIDVIGRDYGFAGGYVSNICKRYGASRAAHMENRTVVRALAFPGRDRQMCDQYQAGMTLEQVGAQHSVTRERVRQILAREGVEERHGGFFKPERVEGRQRLVANREVRAAVWAEKRAERADARARYDAGQTYGTIAEALGHSVGWVQQAIWATGGPSKNPKARKPKKKLTQEQREDIARRYAANEAAETIGKDFDIVPEYVARIAIDLGCYRPGYGPGVTAATKKKGAKAAALSRTGLPEST